MSDISHILVQIEQGDPGTAEELLPLVYHELRRVAAAKLAQEKPGQTLQPTALVHEAYVRLVDVDKAPSFKGRGHFFAAAAEAMRRILVERARRKRRLKHGGCGERLELADDQVAGVDQCDLILSVDESLSALAQQNPQAAELVRLRYFAGLTLSEAATAIDISTRTADRLWAYAKAFLHQRLES